MNKRRESLGVNSKTIETVYREYLEGAYAVNRRYQRKLVWTVQEKERLIDSILNQYPLPQFLVAEDSTASNHQFEIIDGMQRLNAIIAFIENEYSLDGNYFDLESLASTKDLKDRGELTQNEPILDRAQSVQIATYEIAQSIYRTSSQSSVEEVFRRINSTGQKLSRQDLRQAGTTSSVADVVREIASMVRGDTSPGTLVPLSGMKAISIAGDQNPYGISPDNMFWVRQGILNRSDVRTSGDEQLILDILADILFNPMMSTGSTVRNGLFQVDDPKLSKADAGRIAGLLDDPTWNSGRKSSLINQFSTTLNRVQSIFAELPAGTKFSRHIGRPGNNPIPRYFESLFVAIWSLIYVHEKDLSNASLAASQLGDTKAFNSIPGGGGEWDAKKKKKTIDDLIKTLKHAFDSPRIAGSNGPTSEVLTGNELDSIISNTLLETSVRELKQGILELSPMSRSIDGNSIRKMFRTLTAISNTRPKHGGHLIIGVVDKDADAARVRELDSVTPLLYRGLQFVGIDREAQLLDESIDQYWDRLIKKLSSASELDRDYARLAAQTSSIASHEGHTIIVLKAPPVTTPVKFDNEYYERISARTELVENQLDFGMRFNQRLTE